MMGMGQQMPMRRPPMGPSPMTAGRPNPMAGFNAPMARTGSPPQVPPWAQHPQGIQAGGGGFQGRPPGMMPPGTYQGVQGVEPNFGGYQGTPPWMGGGGGMPGSSFSGVAMNGIPYQSSGAIQGGGGPMPQMQAALGQMQGAMGGGFNPSDIGSEGGPSGARWAQMQGAMGGGPQVTGGGMMLPGGGPPGQMKNYLGDMAGAMGGQQPPRQRRFPGALGRGIMQAMAPPPQAAPPAPYGGQQFRMW